MRKCRLTFEKLGKPCYVSHLDLMRLFRRAFSRAELPVKHSEGYNPHPIMSILLPLSTGHESVCEILDVELDDAAGSTVAVSVGSFGALPERLNVCLPSGIRVTAAALPLSKPGDLAFIKATLTLDAGCEWQLPSEPLNVQKLSKNGNVREFVIEPPQLRLLSPQTLECTVTPDLNPALIGKALLSTPGFFAVRRTALIDRHGNTFR
jgi:radical SAM-linked protein